MIRLIGCTGRKFNGKDSLGNHIIRSRNAIRVAYADLLKKIAEELFGFTYEQLYGNEKEIEDKFWKVTPRKVLQFIGTDLFREQLHLIMPWIGKDIWVKAVEKKILDIWKNNENQVVVITDVRFDNEVDAVKNLGGIVIRVNRPSVNTDVDVHPSEINIEKLDADINIINDGTLDDLYEKFECALKEFEENATKQ